MRVSTCVAVALVISTVAPSAQSRESERASVLNIVQTFFDTMTAKDVAGARAILQPQGRFHAMRSRDGKPDVHAFANEEYFSDLQASKQVMRERTWNPAVRIHG